MVLINMNTVHELTTLLWSTEREREGETAWD